MIGRELEDIITKYFVDGPEALREFLGRSEKTIAIAALSALLDVYATDKNSSTLRELITVTLSGYRPILGKLGYNGERGGINCEAKPRNIETTSSRKHNGGGNYSDLTYDRLDKYKKENPNTLVSGFVDGRLIFILEFPFAYSGFCARLKEQLDNRFHGHIETGLYLRSASFSHRNYQDCPQLALNYLSKELLNKYSQSFTRGFYRLLLALSGGEDGGA